MRPMSSIATFVLAALVATSAAKAAGGATTLPAPQAVESDDQPVADPTPREIVKFTGRKRLEPSSSTHPNVVSILCCPDSKPWNMRSALGGLDLSGPASNISPTSAHGLTGRRRARCSSGADLPRHMAGGIDNPLGARAMYLSGTLYRIHGSNEADTIGQEFRPAASE